MRLWSLPDIIWSWYLSQDISYYKFTSISNSEKAPRKKPNPVPSLKLCTTHSNRHFMNLSPFCAFTSTLLETTMVFTFFTFRWNYWKTTYPYPFLVLDCQSSLYNWISYDNNLRCKFKTLWSHIDHFCLCLHVSKEFRLQFIFISLIYNLFYFIFYLK